MNCNDATNTLHDAAALLGYAVTYQNLCKRFNRARRYSLRQMEIIRHGACVACDAVPARQSREIYSAAYDAGERAAINDLSGRS